MKILKSKKALSPVVASIILIAVTVAVSIAVAAWMGALTFSFMGGAEQLNVGNPWGWGKSATNGYVYVNVTNNGGSSIVLSSVRVNNTVATLTVDYPSGKTMPYTLAPGASAGLNITVNFSFEAGVPYTFRIVTSTNHEFQTIGVPPGP